MIVITAASGQLGRLTLEALLNRGVPAGRIRAAVRDRAKLADFAARGVEIVEADYADKESLVRALTGAEKFLLISSVGQDEERRQSWQVAVRTYEVMVRTYTDFGYDLVELPRAPVAQRIAFVLREAGLAA